MDKCSEIEREGGERESGMYNYEVTDCHVRYEEDIGGGTYVRVVSD